MFNYQILIPSLLCSGASLIFVLIISMLVIKYKEADSKSQEYYLRYKAESKFNSDLKRQIKESKYENFTDGNSK